MNCEQIQPSLLDYSRGLLSGPESAAVRAHLRNCAQCAELLKEEIDFHRNLADLPEERPANDIWALVRTRTKPTRLRAPLALLGRMPIVLRRAVCAAAAVAVMAVGFYSLKPADHQSAQKIPTTVTVKWSDDPIGGHTDAMVNFIDEM